MPGLPHPLRRNPLCGYGAENMSLPDSDWLYLRDATDLIKSEADITEQDALKALTEAGKDNKITARGEKDGRIRSRGAYLVTISPSDWLNKIQVDNNTLGLIRGIQIQRSSLMAWLSGKVAAATIPAYVPGYLSLLFRAIEENNISPTNQPKAETLQAWFKNQSVEGHDVSQKQAEVMATIVRLPEARIGGVTKKRRAEPFTPEGLNPFRDT